MIKELVRTRTILSSQVYTCTTIDAQVADGKPYETPYWRSDGRARLYDGRRIALRPHHRVRTTTINTRHVQPRLLRARLWRSRPESPEARLAEADSKSRASTIRLGYGELTTSSSRARRFNGWTAQIIQHGIDFLQKGKLV